MDYSDIPITKEGFLSVVAEGIVDHTQIDFDETVAHHLGIFQAYEASSQPIQGASVYIVMFA